MTGNRKGVVLPKKYEWVDTSSPAFKEALEAIFDDDIPYVSIIGPGGCGKSLLYRIAYDIGSGNRLCTASTGVAAFNIAKEGVPAVTLHSALKIEPRDWYDPEDMNRRTLSILRKTDMLLIDEISMVSVNFMDYLVSHIEEASRKRGRHIKVVMFGDVMQLLPVTKAMSDEIVSPRWKEMYGSNRMFFNSPLLKAQRRRTVELYEVYRQDDSSFRAILNSIRLGSVTNAMLDVINRHVCQLDEFKADVGKDGMMYLAGTNNKVDALNEEYQKEFEKGGNLFAEHLAELSGDVHMNDFPGVPEDIRLYQGQQVMCTMNDTGEEKSYQNGTIGRVVAFTKGLPIVKTKDGRRFPVKRQIFTRYRMVLNKDTGFMEPEEVGSATQVACKSAYAVTYHKAQGLTLDALYMDLSGWMAPHSIYLGLSRLRSLDGLGLSRRLRASDIRIDSEAIGFFSSDRDVIVKA